MLHGEQRDGRGNSSCRGVSAAGRSVTCRDFWRSRCRFPTAARDRPLAIVRLSQHVSSRERRHGPSGNSRVV